VARAATINQRSRPRPAFGRSIARAINQHSIAVALAVVIALSGSAGAKPSPAAAHLRDGYAAYRRGDLAQAWRELAPLAPDAVTNRDYLLWVRGTVALRTGELAVAQADFTRLAKLTGSRFAGEAGWRLADVAWARGDRAAAAKAYARLIATPSAGELGDVGTARFRIAETRSGAAARAAYRELVLAHPAHPLSVVAEQRLIELGAPALTPDERIERAKALTLAHLWDEAVAELSLLDAAELTPAQINQRDYWLGTTLFKMRRRYGDAGELLLGVYPKLGATAAEAMFHGARALSRADRDTDAIRWYNQVVATYPRTAWAEEAQFLTGWLEFNRGDYAKAIGPLEQSLARYPRSKWADDALWFLGMSYYFLGDWPKARARLDAMARRGGALEGGKGAYWLARLDDKLGAKPAAIAGYTALAKRYPFSWYALLAAARLEAHGAPVGPFGEVPGTAVATRGGKLATAADPALASDALIRQADELIAIGLTEEAGLELVRGERAFLKRHDRRRGAAFATLLDRYRAAGNFNRPWMLAIIYGGGALDGPAEDDARRWWENAYPRAYRELVEKHQQLGDNPEGYLYSIMRKESGFDPHVLSYADAQGLLQMIPATTKRVAKELKLPYDDGRLYDPPYNIQTGSWYIGRLLAKFKHQVPLGAGSFNCGPRPVMKWLDRYGDRELDELVELVPFTQTREYMKKVTENYARYRYLYQHEVYKQPLVVDKQYLRNQLTY
jgi:soluble lytic murein transglycosylase